MKRATLWLAFISLALPLLVFEGAGRGSAALDRLTYILVPGVIASSYIVGADDPKYISGVGRLIIICGSAIPIFFLLWLCIRIIKGATTSKK